MPKRPQKRAPSQRNTLANWTPDFNSFDVAAGSRMFIGYDARETAHERALRDSLINGVDGLLRQVAADEASDEKTLGTTSKGKRVLMARRASRTKALTSARGKVQSEAAAATRSGTPKRATRVNRRAAAIDTSLQALAAKQQVDAAAVKGINLSSTRNVLVGGDNRPMAADRIQRAFAFSELEWERGWRVRKVGSLAKRIEAGNVDLVILLRRFMSHWVFDHVVPACRTAGVPFVVVDTGYGVEQIRLALERYLDGSPEGG